MIFVEVAASDVALSGPGHADVERAVRTPGWVAGGIESAARDRQRPTRRGGAQADPVERHRSARQLARDEEAARDVSVRVEVGLQVNDRQVCRAVLFLA